jgi:hypothetical protein
MTVDRRPSLVALLTYRGGDTSSASPSAPSIDFTSDRQLGAARVSLAHGYSVRGRRADCLASACLAGRCDGCVTAVVQRTSRAGRSGLRDLRGPSRHVWRRPTLTLSDHTDKPSTESGPSGFGSVAGSRRSIEIGGPASYVAWCVED